MIDKLYLLMVYGKGDKYIPKLLKGQSAEQLDVPTDATL